MPPSPMETERWHPILGIRRIIIVVHVDFSDTTYILFPFSNLVPTTWPGVSSLAAAAARFAATSPRAVPASDDRLGQCGVKVEAKHL